MKKKLITFTISTIVLTLMLSLTALCAETFAPGSSAAYFVDNINGKDTNEGTSASAPLKTLGKANEFLAKTKGGSIVICGKVEISNAYTPANVGGAVIYTSVWGSTDYRETNGAKLIIGANMAFENDTYFKNINLSITESSLIFSGHCNNFGFGTGITVTNNSGAASFTYPSILGGYNNPTDLNATSNAKDYSVHVYSGTWESVCTGNRRSTSAYVISSLRGDISLIIKGGTFGGCIYGTGMNVHTGRLYMEISGGTFKDRILPVRRIGSVNNGVDCSALEFTANVLVEISGGTFKSDFQLAESNVDNSGATFPPKGDATVVVTGGSFSGKVLGYGVIGSVLLKYDDTVLSTKKIDGWPAVKTSGLSMSSSATEKARFTNPISDKNDPYVVEKDGIYYFAVSSGVQVNGKTYPGLKVAAHGSIGFGNLHMQIRPVYNATLTNDPYMKQEYWAPELHYFDAATVGSANAGWYMYFCADNGNEDNHRMFVLRATDPENPLSDYKLMGKIYDSTNRYAIDGTVLQLNGKLYFLWSGWASADKVRQNIYIAKMSNPWTISGERVLLSTPEYTWEKQGWPDVNEGPQALQYKGSTHIVYSAGGCWHEHYCYGMLTLTGTDPMNPAHWYKASSPVFKSGNGMYGPGHGSFVQDSSGQWWMYYHANTEKNTGSNDAYLTARSVYVKPFSFVKKTINGKSVYYPSFGTPAADGGTQYVQVRTADYHASGDHLYSPVMKTTSGTAESLTKTCYICGTTTTIHKVDVPTLKVETNASGNILLTITPKVTGASGYIIYRATSADGIYKEIARTSSTTYTDKDTKFGQVYYYKVKQYKAKAYGTDATYGILASDASSAASITATLGAVEIEPYYDGNVVTLKWKSDENVAKYRVLRRNYGSTAWTELATVTTASYTDTTISAGKKYEYAVESQAISNGTTYKSPLAVAAIEIVNIDVPTLTLENKADGVAITVIPSDNAEGYKIYRSTDGKNFEQIAKTTTTSFVDTTTVSGTLYYYNARAYTQTNGISYSAVSQSTQIVFVSPITPSVIYDGDAIKLSWTSCKNAEKYRIFKRVSGESSWNDDAVFVNSTSYSDKSAVPGTKYDYAVQAWVKCDNSYSYSPISVVSATATALGMPTLTAKNTTEGVKLTTTAVANAEGYKFYRSTDGKNFVQVAKIATTSFVDAEAKVGTTYYYRVRAYIIGDGIINYSPVSDSDAIVRIYPMSFKIYHDGTGVFLSWSKVEAADKYRIFRRVSGESAWDGVSRMTASTSYTDTTAVADVTYEYSVQAWVPVADGSYCYSPLEVQTISYTALDTPTLTANVTDAGISLTTTEVENADGYKFYRSTDGKNFEQIAKTSSTSFVDSDIKKNTAYYYNVRAYKTGVGISYSKISDNVAVISLRAITPDIEYTDGNVTLTWTPSKTAAKYRVFRRVAGESAWDGVTRMTLETTYTDTTVAKDTAYEYAVQDWTLLDGKHRYGPLSVYTVTTSALNAPTLTADISDEGVFLTNSKVSGATGYMFYRSNNGTSYKLIANSISPSYLDTTVTDGAAYYYKTVAYAQSDNVINYSEYSAACLVNTASPDAPTLEATIINGNILLTASNVSKISGYKFFRSSDGVSFEELGVSSTNTYTDASAELGSAYYYKACTYTQNEIITTYSSDSNVVFIVDFVYEQIESGDTYDAVASRAKDTEFTVLERRYACSNNIALKDIPNGTYVYSVYGDFILDDAIIDEEISMVSVPYGNADALIFAVAPLINYGDADNNGEITILDVLKTLKASVGVQTELDVAAANVNGDLEISVIDALEIINMLLN